MVATEEGKKKENFLFLATFIKLTDHDEHNLKVLKDYWNRMSGFQRRLHCTVG